MGWKDTLDSLFGKTTLPKATIDDLFSISTARITMESGLNLKPSTAAGLCFKPIESAQFPAARTEIEELLQLSSRETGTTFRITTDEFRFTWVVLEDPDFDDLVTGLHMVSQTLIERGFGAYSCVRSSGLRIQNPCTGYTTSSRDGTIPLFPSPIRNVTMPLSSG